MSKPSGQKRTYNAARRQAQAQETRRQILHASRELFVTRGFSGATIEAIAQQAGVATETVYAIFKSKKVILAELVEVSVTGDDSGVPLLERPGPRAVAQETKPHKQVRMFAGQIAEIMTRVAPLFEVMNGAAKTEPEIAELRARILHVRLEGMGFFVRALTQRGRLRQGLTAERAAETVWALTSAEVFRLLTVDRGWTVEEYVEWLAGALEGMLLG